MGRFLSAVFSRTIRFSTSRKALCSFSRICVRKSRSQFFRLRDELISVLNSKSCLYARLYAPEKNSGSHESQWVHPKSERKQCKIRVCPGGDKLRVNGSRSLNLR